MASLLDSFVREAPKPRPAPATGNLLPDPIDGCSATPLLDNSDSRGSLIELMTTRDGRFDPIPHVYQVIVAPRSIRAWIYHALQSDRIAFTAGRLRVVLYDARDGSPTFGKLNEIVVGEGDKVLLTIAPRVIHGVQNLEDAASAFVNLPTRAYDHSDPDKYRLPADSPLIPYSFAGR